GPRRRALELARGVDHRWRDAAAVEVRAGTALAEIAQQEPRAAAQVDDHRTCWQARPDLSAEERPEGRLESLPVGRDHPLQELLVRRAGDRLMSGHVGASPARV